MQNIRPASLPDLGEIVRIYNSTIPFRTATADLIEISVESRLEWFKEHDVNTYPIYVWEENQKILGWMSLSKFHPRKAYSITAELSIYVDESSRGKGIGNGLFEFALKISPSLSFTNLIGLIFAHNIPSIELSKRNGFEIWGHLPAVCELDGIKRDVVIMGRAV